MDRLRLNSFDLREYDAQDQDQLLSLWCGVFGDPPKLVRSFFRLLPEMGTCCVAVQDTQLLGAAYLIDGFTLLTPGQPSRRCGYLYAVAVAEPFRGAGIGAAVSRGAAELGRKRGADLICTLPAEDSLYCWYEEILSLTCVSTRRRLTLVQFPSAAEPLQASEYLKRRERILADTPHVIPNPAAMEFQQGLCETYGGGLYADGSYVFCAYRDGDCWMIPEVLPVSAGLQTDVTDAVPYLCSDVPLPDGLVWNLTFD